MLQRFYRVLTEVASHLFAFFRKTLKSRFSNRFKDIAASVKNPRFCANAYRNVLIVYIGRQKYLLKSKKVVSIYSIRTLADQPSSVFLEMLLFD